jgi:hypothetical protein
MEIRSFGCSFTAGTDLVDCEQNWPQILAKRLNVLCLNYSEPGTGNLFIAESVLRHARPGDFCIINWTYIDRFDFVDPVSEEWKSILPGDTANYSKTYYRYLHSQYRDMLSNLLTSVAVVDFLEKQSIPFMMTVIDDLWFELVHDSWHNSTAVTRLQSRLRQHVFDFEGQNFLSWARQKSYSISVANHPLDQAHVAAADLMQPVIESILHRA